MRKLAALFAISALLLSAVDAAAQRRGGPGRGSRGGGEDESRRPSGMGGPMGGGPPGMMGRGGGGPGGGPGGMGRGGGPPGMMGPGGGPSMMGRGGGPPGMMGRGGGPPGMMGRGGGPPGMGGDRGRGPGGRGGGFGGSPEERASRLEGFLRSMDADRDGVLEPSEIPEDRRRMLGFMAERAGFDPEKPIRLEQVRENLIRRYSGEEGRGRDDEDKDSDEPEPLVPGFGVQQELARVPAFGERVDYAELLSGGASSGRSSSRSSSDRDRDSERESRIRRFADSMFYRYDRNRSGVLEREEWGEMRMAQGADRNNDGKITKDELTNRLAEYSGRRRGEEDGNSSGSSSDSEPIKSGRDRSYRFTGAADELVSGLPEWFDRCDVNGDGQVAMAERYSDWSDTRAREFLSYDRNGDGLITRHEAADGPAVGVVAAGPFPGGVPPAGPVGGVPAPKPAPTPSTEQGGEKPWWLQ